MKSKFYSIALIIIAAITIISFVGWFVWKPAPVLLQGEVQASSIKISSQMPGRVDSLQISRGQSVRKGDLLFVITSKTVDAKLTQAQALKNAATAQNTKVDNGARQQIIDQAYQMYQNSLVGLTLAQKTFERVKNLYNTGVVPEQRYDEVSAQMTAAQNTSKAAFAQWQMAKEGAQWEDKASAKAIVNQAQGGVMEVESYLTDGAQYAPFDGTVSSIIAEQGELVGAGYPVATIIDLGKAWVSFNVKETLLPKLTVGKKFTGFFPALGQNYELEVTFIASEASYATWAATRTTGEFDVRTFQVQARPTAKEAIKNIRSGMSVTVNMDTL
ncbi:MAG: HlyD family efflux transporter periplasmic adaptor subunit [Mucinivorans sp.]